MVCLDLPDRTYRTSVTAALTPGIVGSIVEKVPWMETTSAEPE
jgi:hypothetical protein